MYKKHALNRLQNALKMHCINKKNNIWTIILILNLLLVPPQITKDASGNNIGITEVKTRVNSSLTLQCESWAMPKPILHWYKDGQVRNEYFQCFPLPWFVDLTPPLHFLWISQCWLEKNPNVVSLKLWALGENLSLWHLSVIDLGVLAAAQPEAVTELPISRGILLESAGSPSELWTAQPLTVRISASSNCLWPALD